MSLNYLLDQDNWATLYEWAHGATLFAFDFDGTLASIVDDPAEASVPPDTWRLLAALGRHANVAVVSGRARGDLMKRLPHEVRYVIGNHGNEGLPQGNKDVDEEVRICSAWYERLMADATLWKDAEGAMVENKGQSLSLHYRNSRNPVLARSRFLARIAKLAPQPRLIRGADVLNLLPPQAITKAQALEALMRDSGCNRVIFVGDDMTDELAFQDAPDHWLTARVGVSVHTDARFTLRNADEVRGLLSHLQSIREQPAVASS